MHPRFHLHTSTQAHRCVAFLQAAAPSLQAEPEPPGLPMVRLPTPPRTLGEHLLVVRYERGLRQKDVARELGVDQFTLGNW